MVVVHRHMYSAVSIVFYPPPSVCSSGWPIRSGSVARVRRNTPVFPSYTISILSMYYSPILSDFVQLTRAASRSWPTLSRLY